MEHKTYLCLRPPGKLLHISTFSGRKISWTELPNSCAGHTQRHTFTFVGPSAHPALKELEMCSEGSTALRYQVMLPVNQGQMMSFGVRDRFWLGFIMSSQLAFSSLPCLVFSQLISTVIERAGTTHFTFFHHIWHISNNTWWAGVMGWIKAAADSQSHAARRFKIEVLVEVS